MKNALLSTTILASALVLAFASPAHAGAKPTVVGNGVKMGAFTVSPTLTTTGRYDSNIHTNTNNNEKDDVIFNIAPEVNVKSDFTQHALTFRAKSDHDLYVTNGRDDRDNYEFGSTGRYDFTKDIKLNANALYAQRHATRGDNETNRLATAAKQIPYTDIRAGAGLDVTQGAFTATPSFSFQNLNYDNTPLLSGATLFQDSRDRNIFIVDSRFGYQVTSEWQAFVQPEFNWRDYKLGGATQRDSDGSSVLVGARYKTADLTAEAAMGYMQQNYDTAVYNDISTLDAMANIDWNFAKQWNAYATYKRSIEETTLARSSSYLADRMAMGLNYTPMDVLNLNAEFRYTDAAYSGGGTGGAGGAEDLNDQRLGFGLGAGYKITNNVAFIADYDYTNYDSNASSRKYNDHVVSAGFKFGL